MKYYSLIEMDLIEKAWVAGYLTPVTRMVERRGGRFLARTHQLERLEGDRPVPQLAVLIEWPSRDAAAEFHASEEYRPYLEMRHAGARCQGLLIAGEDVTRTREAAP